MKLFFILLVSPILLVGQIVENVNNVPKEIGLVGNKYSVIEFWASWCKPCLETFPKIKKIEHAYKNDFEFILINSYDSIEKINKILDEYQIESKSIIDSTSVLSNLYKIDMLGTIIIYNKDKSKSWTGYSEILTDSELDDILRYGKIPGLLQGQEFLNISNDNYKLKLSAGHPNKKREITIGENYIKINNVNLSTILRHLNNELNIIDNSIFPLPFTFELTSHSNKNINYEVVDKILGLIEHTKNTNQILIQTDHLLDDIEF